MRMIEEEIQIEMETETGLSENGNRHYPGELIHVSHRLVSWLRVEKFERGFCYVISLVCLNVCLVGKST